MAVFQQFYYSYWCRMIRNDSADAPTQSHLTPSLCDVLGSATAGVFSRIITHPLDTVKARIQVTTAFHGHEPNGYSFRGPLDALIRTYRQEGFRALYGGFGAVIVGGTPGTVLYLSGYNFFKNSITRFVSKSNPNFGTEAENRVVPLSQSQEFIIHFSSGMLAEALTCIIYVPVDVVKERMQVQQRLLDDVKSNNLLYKSSGDALKSIVKSEGLSGIYKGYAATLASFGTFSALYFVLYERSKAFARERFHHVATGSGNNLVSQSLDDGDLPFFHLVLCSAGAGALASWFTSPLDMAKLRLQVQRGRLTTIKSPGNGFVNHNVHYRGVLHCLRMVYMEDGIRGLFRGAGARVIHFTPATAITMTCYEKCRSFYSSIL